jgi:hypothetical protein
MNSQKGYTGYGSGILDLQKLADEMLNPDSTTHTYLDPDMGFDPSSIDAVCVAEARSMIAKAPRVIICCPLRWLYKSANCVTLYLKKSM